MRFLLFAGCFGIALACGAEGSATPTPLGTWRVIGDVSHEPEALVTVEEVDGQYVGRIAQVLPRPGIDVNGVCEACPGARKNQPLRGLVILEGLRRHGDEFSGGTILDPDSGELYRCTMSVSPDNRRLFVRGYIGISLFGRTQTWLREK
jgi:uncharacterized protein (DUF2147 family)